MDKADNEELSEYDLMRKRNFETNKELLSYLNLQESTIDLDKDSLDSNLAEILATTSNSPKPKRKYRHSPLPPTRPRSQRLREREERLKGTASTSLQEPLIVPPNYYDQFEAPVRQAKRTTRNSPSLARGSEVPRQCQVDLKQREKPVKKENAKRNLSGDVIEKNDWDISCSPRICSSCGNYFLIMSAQAKVPPNATSRGKKNLCATILIMLYALWDGYQKDDCCKKTISKLLLIGVIIILIINMLNLLIFSKDETRQQIQR